MAHEHQRAKRDTYVRYDCTKLLDYSDAYVRGRLDNPTLTSHQLCTDVLIAEKYSFSGRSFMQTVELDGTAGYTLNSETPYDVNSVMRYHSYIMGDENCQRGDQAQCPLEVDRDSNVSGSVLIVESRCYLDNQTQQQQRESQLWKEQVASKQSI
jgi:hypothetical protein